MAISAGSSQLARCAAKINAGLPSLAQALEPLGGLERVADVAVFLPRRREDLQAIDVSKFRGNAPEIIPNATQDVLRFRIPIFRGKAAARLARPMRCSLSRGPRVRMNAAATSAIDLRSMARIVRSIPTASRPAACRCRGLELSPGVRGIERHHARGSRRRQKRTMIFPNTCRLSSRASPRSNSASGTSVSITGKSPLAILARLSRILRREAPNDPMIRYCC